jgi:DNA-binding Lrp family transcriptional regulator
MDLIDKKIICELDLNCRTPLTKMAKKLRIGRNVLAYRIKKLQEEGIITDYICSISLGKLGFKTYKIYCKMRSFSSNSEKDFIEFIKNEQAVIHLLKTEGSFDFAFVIAVKNIKELDNFLSSLKTKFRSELEDCTVSIVVSSRIFKMSKLLLEDKHQLIKFDKYNEVEEPITLDEKDRLILSILSKEANISIVDLSEKTKLSLDVIKYRIKELSSRLISSYRAIIDMNKLGYFHYVILLKIRNSSIHDEEALMNWCANRQNIMYYTKRIGSFDFEINAAIKDINELNTLIHDLKKNFAEIINSYEFIINTKIIKLNYFPI